MPVVYLAVHDIHLDYFSTTPDRKGHFYSNRPWRSVAHLFREIGPLQMLIRRASSGGPRTCQYRGILTDVRLVDEDSELQDLTKRREYVIPRFGNEGKDWRWENDLEEILHARTYYEISNLEEIESIPQDKLTVENTNEPLDINFTRGLPVICELQPGVEVVPLTPRLMSPNLADKEPVPGDPYEDARKKTVRELKARRGQGRFRDAVRNLANDRCMITGCTVLDLLEAAHIRPYRGQPNDNDPENGLLLRSDIHVLFDVGLIVLNGHTGTIQIDSSLRGTEYKQYDGTRLACEWTNTRRQFCSDRPAVLANP